MSGRSAPVPGSPRAYRVPGAPPRPQGLRADEFLFRRTDRDRRPARKVMTPVLMGDPEPGRTPWARR